MYSELNKNFEHIKNQSESRKFYSEVFILKCNIELSSFAKKILKSCCNKQFYHVLETIEYGLKSNLQERDYLLQIFYSIGIAMQNKKNARFFDIQIDDIEIKKICNLHKINSKRIEIDYLRIRSFCSVKQQKKKKEPYW